jgi:nucleoside-diphosphate-sugar epimerase
MIFLTGSSGFVGSSFLSYFNNVKIQIFNRGEDLFFNNAKIVIHLAGKAHDIKNTTTPDEYYQVNTELTKKVFDTFLVSDARVFITLSSVKAVADEVRGELTEEYVPNPITHYGKSKLLAEQYILSKQIPESKRIYILRPCMIHGPGNKGNLNLLYNIISAGIPWPLGAFDNKRSFCSIDNLMFIFKELIEREDIPSGIYNVADNEPISTNLIVSLIAKSRNKQPKIWNIYPEFIQLLAKFGDLSNLPLNTERLGKLTQNYIVSNKKILTVIGKELPLKNIDGMIKTINGFKFDL